MRSAGLLALVGPLLGGEVTAAVVDRVCAEAAGLLRVDAVAVTVTAGGSPVTIGASDAVARRAGLVELTVGVGPGTQATATGVAVTVNDVNDVDPGLDRWWPDLGGQLSGLGVAAVAAAPLQAGPVTLGSLQVYRRRPHRWTDTDVADLTRTARVLGLALATVPGDGLADRDRDVDGDVGDPAAGDWAGGGLLGAGERALAQATGMVMAAFGEDSARAVSRLRAAAFGGGRLLTAVAADVVTGRRSVYLGDHPRPVRNR